MNPLRPLRAALLGIAVAVSHCGGDDPPSPGLPSLPVPPASTPGPQIDGPAWWGFGRDAAHSGQAAIASQDLSRVTWSTHVDEVPQYVNGRALLTHYGSPVVTSHNTVVFGVKTGAGFRIEARSGVNGGLVWAASSDYVFPPHHWVPGYNVALTRDDRLVAPGAGGKVWLRDQADSAAGSARTRVFFGDAAYAAAPAAFDTTVFINTPLTVDPAGNVFFGFVVTGANPAGLASGIARLGADGSGRWIGAALAAADGVVAKPAMNSAPALSPDGATLYVALNTAPDGTPQRGMLLALDAATLAVKHRAALVDPASGAPARVSDDSTASPTVGPDGRVFFGVQENPSGSHNGRGWLLPFDATLAGAGAPGGFGWDDTASVVPSALVPQYSGPSSYLLMVKYNNYAGYGGGDGANRVAVIDPRASQADPHSSRQIMREVLTLLGPTFESGNAGPVKEWCINTAAVDVARGSVLVNSEDGHLYRWDLASNTFSQRIQLNNGIAESYTPTTIGADGTVYAINNAVLFAVGR